MTWQAMIGWGFGILVAAGIEFALGGGTPGPLFLVALAAGLFTGIIPGAIIGACAGLCTACMSATPLLPMTVLFTTLAALVSLIGAIFSQRNLVVAIFAAAMLSFLVALGWALFSTVPFLHALALAGQRCLINSLWMLAIYGIVLVFSIPQHPPLQGGNI